ncbi:hypothetical protein PHLGIDRAFT_16479 [Phlebiopsis gigantea 11061_1 CR5-6]|uniref:Mid2 domain-containing protein n=1 Tax=Phlebiopsis gigantea (strain 11061_1 CR5-6) TaxID=745531 RepID=A0A0C3RR96_PHLG1|nr:hypothetical protein PHLGIDRAFT_16479 [Phlebiopsis gigantea 11061_1 CR5-6]
MFPSPLAALPLLASLVAMVAAQETSELVVVDFYTDVLYSPPEAWHTGTNAACQTVDHFTAEVNASATINFVGDRISVEGMHNNASGVLFVQVDDMTPYALNLWSDNVECGLFVDYFLGNGSHTMTLTLHNIDEILNTTLGEENEGSIVTPVLHLTNIEYWIPQPAAAEATSTSVAGDLASSSSSTKNIAAIVAGTVCGVVGLAAVVVGIFFWRKRRTQKGRHTFNPNTVFIVFITDLSPTAPDSAAKFGAYAQFDDDAKSLSETKSAGLDVPELHYSKSGLRSRSRSPMPYRSPMP